MSNKPLKREIITTKDGSKTLYIPELDENYHSVNGAIQESNHVFIDRGMKEMQGLSVVNIFEVGFGSGLNAILSYINKSDKTINYTSIEKYPLSHSEIQELDHASAFAKLENIESVFKKMHDCEWNNEVEIDDGFNLCKVKSSLDKYELEAKYNVIYFDAFAPEIQPNLWTIDVFDKMYKSLKNGGVLVTYCAKGQVRRNMQAVGFMVERLPGPPGKREMLRAVKA